MLLPGELLSPRLAIRVGTSPIACYVGAISGNQLELPALIWDSLGRNAMLQLNLPREVAIGDEVALTSTVMDMLPSGRARVSIPSYDRPYAIDAPPRTHVGDKVVLVGDVTRVDPETNKLSVRIDCGGVVTVHKSAIIRLKKNCAARNG